LITAAKRGFAGAPSVGLKLLKIGALVRRSVRRVTVAVASAFPHPAEFALTHARLTARTK
jgi:hypothetical protein